VDSLRVLRKAVTACYVLKGALYGLRLLRQKELYDTMPLRPRVCPRRALPILGWLGNSFFFFMYIVCKEHREEMESIKAKLSTKYEMRNCTYTCHS
jgi:hypothetical protein